MVDLGRAFTYFSTSLECMPSTLIATTYLYGAAAAAASTGMVQAKPARPSRDAGNDNILCFSAASISGSGVFNQSFTLPQVGCMQR